MASPIRVSVVSRIEPAGSLSDEFAPCWMEVANSGGAVGFAFTPVDLATVCEAVGKLATELRRGTRAVIEARVGEDFPGWVSIRLNDTPLTSHWATIEHLQSHVLHRWIGVGGALLTGAVDHAVLLGLEQLVLAVRGGEGLEPFCERFGWNEIGRHADALRLATSSVHRATQPVSGAINLLSWYHCRLASALDCSTSASPFGPHHQA